jgi:hypothetical protein
MWRRSRLVVVAAACAAAAILSGARAAPPRSPAQPARPPRLADTGLYADFAARALAPGVFPYSPQYPLWTDGAAKRRWIQLPPGAAVDGRDPRRWRFPVGTKLWKEFAYGQRVETRFLERTTAGWAYATYVWTPDGADAVLAPERGVPAAYVKTSGAVRHDIPSLSDCHACHRGGRGSEVLGFELLQLSPDRDPLAPGAVAPEPGSVDLATLVARGLLRGVPARLLDPPPRVAAVAEPERAALGYLHGNCAHCHGRSNGALAELGLSLVAPLAGERRPAAGARETAVGVASRYRPPGSGDEPGLRIAPGDPGRSVLLQRMASRHAVVQMPPLGTSEADAAATRLVGAWIEELGAGAAVARSHRRPVDER